jgi:hypothetical protein
MFGKTADLAFAFLSVIPGGNLLLKGKSRFPSGMTERKANTKKKGRS